MKNFKEEIEAMKAQIAALENNLVCGCDECECEDQVTLTRGEVTEEPYVKTISGGYMNVGEAIAVFTREELIDFATRLMERTATACKEAVHNTEFEPDYICGLSLNYNNQIEVEIDNEVIRDTVSNEIDDTIETDENSVGVEVDNILRDMLNEKQS